MKKKEIWKNIRGYTGKYQVSSLGRVRSLERWVKNAIGAWRRVPPKILSLCRHCKGYLLVCLCKNGDDLMKTVHRLVAFAFHRNPKRKKFVNHLDGDKENNCRTNLRWATASENMIHAYRMGLHNGSAVSKC